MVHDERSPGGVEENERFRSLSVLVCDMVGSTDVRVRLGADGERLLRLQETLARDAVSAQAGTVIKSLGDGTMAVFEAAADAVAAGVRLQRSLEALHRRGEAAELRLRIGVSAGDVSVGADDCYGLPVAEAVRLCAAADGGEVLVAEVVRALARHTLAVPLTAAGEFELRGMDEPVRAWRADWRPRPDGWPSFPLPTRLAAPAEGRFVGRRLELEAQRAWLGQGGGARLLFVGGEPGVGKSALAAELARRLHTDTGAAVAHGGCDEELRPPYQPFVQALQHVIKHAPTATLERYVRRHGGDIALLAPGLVERLGRVAPPRTTAEESDRYLLFRAVASLLEEVVDEAPLVLVLDDLHWADRGTLLLLKHVLTSVDLPGLIVVATFRSTDLGSAPELQDLLAELHRFNGVARLDLNGLQGDELTELAELLLPSSPDDLADVARTVHRETEGNPFFAVELLRHLRETGPDHGGWLIGDLPPSVREVVRRRVQRLGDDVVRLLSCGAVLGAEFHLQAVAEVAGMPPDTALDLLEAAVDATILREVPDHSRFRFVHALVQHTLFEDMSRTRRRRLHRAAAEAAERLESASTSAAHWLAAEDLGDVLRTVAACTAAADEAVLARAPDEAAGWYEAALSRLDVADDPALGCELLLRLGEAQRLAGDPQHRETLVRAAVLARELGDAERLARAALANTRWFSSSVGNENRAQIELLEAALDAVGPEPSPTRARLLATLVAELVYSDRPNDRFALAEEALAIARAVGDQDALFEVLFWRNTVAKTVHADSGRDDAEVEELLRIADAGADPLRQGMADLVFVLRALENGCPGRAEAAMARATRVAEELRLPVLRWLVTVMRGTLAALAGDIADAEKLAFEALEQSQATDQPDRITWFGVQLYMVRYEQGRMGELVDMAHARIAKSPRLLTWHCSLVMSLTELDRIDEARPVVRELLDAGYQRRRGEPHWIIGMMCLGSAVAAIGDPADAQTVYEALAPCEGRWASVMPMSLGAVDRVLGELATAAGRLDDAERHFRSAIAAHDAAPTPGYAARSRLGLARVLVLQDDHANADAIADLTSQVRQLTDRYELPRVSALLESFDGPATSAYPSVPRQGEQHVDV